MDILQLRDVRYTYQTQYQKVEALKGITHGFDTGRVHAIVGGFHLMGCMLSAASCNKWLMEDIFQTKDYGAEQAPSPRTSWGTTTYFSCPTSWGSAPPSTIPTPGAPLWA